MSRSLYVLTPLCLSITPALLIAVGLLFIPLPALATETLFRLMLTRPPVAQLEEAPSIATAQDSDFQKAILQATTSSNPREALKTAARTFVATSTFVGNPHRLGLYQPLRKLALGLDSLQKNPVVTNDDVAKRIEGAFGAKPANLVQNKTLEKPMEALKDSILAIKLLPEEHRRPLADLTNQLRDLEVILKVASDSSFPGDGNALRRYRNRSLQLPTDLALLSILLTLVPKRGNS